MQRVKAVRVNKPETGGERRWHSKTAFNERNKTMKTLTKLALAAVILCSAFAAQAQVVRGHFRSNGTYVLPYYRTHANGIPYDNLSYRGYPSQQPGYVSPGGSSSHDYVYRNPYAASPSVSVRGYTRTDGTFVAPHYRTPPNHTLTDNLSYRGYGTIRVPRYSSGW